MPPADLPAPQNLGGHHAVLRASPLASAILAGDIGLVNELLAPLTDDDLLEAIDQKACVLTDGGEFTALQAACIDGASGCLSAMLRQAADRNLVPRLSELRDDEDDEDVFEELEGRAVMPFLQTCRTYPEQPPPDGVATPDQALRFSCLVLAAKHGRVECVRAIGQLLPLLINWDEDVPQGLPFWFRQLALRTACFHKHAECARVLVERLNTSCSTIMDGLGEDGDSTALDLACYSGAAGCVRVLLQARVGGPAPSRSFKSADEWIQYARISDTRSALRVACARGHFDCAELVLEHMVAKPSLDHREAETLYESLVLALERRAGGVALRIARLITRHNAPWIARIDREEGYEAEALWLACILREDDLFEALLSIASARSLEFPKVPRVCLERMCYNKQRKDDTNLLAYACRAGHEFAARCILHEPAFLKALLRIDTSRILLAATHAPADCMARIVRLVLDACPDVERESVIADAIQRADADAVELLLSGAFAHQDSTWMLQAAANLAKDERHLEAALRILRLLLQSQTLHPRHAPLPSPASDYPPRVNALIHWHRLRRKMRIARAVRNRFDPNLPSPPVEDTLRAVRDSIQGGSPQAISALVALNTLALSLKRKRENPS